MPFSVHAIIIPNFPQVDSVLCYHTRTQAMTVITQELKHLIEANSPDLGRFEQEIKMLNQMGIVVRNFDDDMGRLKAHMHQLKYKVNPTIFPVTILTTYACNFKCTYCFEESSRTTEKMTKDVADQTIAWVKEKIVTLGYQRLYLNFYGGEPLLNQPILEYIVDQLRGWCKENHLAFGFMMQTNGYLMTSALIDKYLSMGLTQVRISVDGVGDDHDKYRPLRGGGPTFQRIMDNILASCRKVKIGISMSFDKGNVDHIERLIKYFDEKGVLKELGRFIFSPIHATLGKHGEAQNIQQAHCHCNYEDEMMVSSNRRIRDILLSYGLPMKSGMSTSVCPVTRDESGCTIDQQGRIFKCNSMLGHPELSTGHVNENMYNKQHHRFVNLDVFNQCPVDCTYMPMCSAGCRLSSFLKNQNFSTATCHKNYLNKMAPEIIKQEYLDQVQHVS